MAAAVRTGVPSVKRQVRSSSRVGVAFVLIVAALTGVPKSSLSFAISWISFPLCGAHSLKGARLQCGRRASDSESSGGEEEKLAKDEKPGAAARKAMAEFKKGDVVDGRVARRLAVGVLLDIGAERMALLKAPREEAFKLEPNEQLQGLIVEDVRLSESKKDDIDVSFPGLTELVAQRPERPSSGKLKKTSKKGEETTMPVDVKLKKKSTKGEKTTDTAAPQAAMRWVLDGNDLAGENGKVIVELRGGLTIESANKKQNTLTLIKGATDSPVKPSQEKGKKQAKKPASDPFADLVEGQSLKGRVRNKNSLGVWIDLGKEKDCLLEPHDKMRLLEYGEELNLVVSSVDHELGRASLRLPDIEKHVAGREQKITALKDLKAGSVVTGHVATIKTNVGTFIDIGAEKDAFMSNREARHSRLKLGDEVKLELTSIDMDKQQLKVKLVKDQKEDSDEGKSF